MKLNKEFFLHHKRIMIAFIAGIIGLTGAFIMTPSISDAKDVQKGIAKVIIRFHVLANSDTEEDQALKLKVKDEVVAYMKDLMPENENIQQTRASIIKNLDKIREKADRIIQAEGYDYPVTAELTHCYFPVKTYGDCTFPAGEYEALRIKIGEAKGKNWWCVLYPNLCFVDSIHAVVPDAEKQELKNVLTEQEYDSITDESKMKIKFRYLKFLNN